MGTKKKGIFRAKKNNVKKLVFGGPVTRRQKMPENHRCYTEEDPINYKPLNEMKLRDVIIGPDNYCYGKESLSGWVLYQHELGNEIRWPLSNIPMTENDIKQFVTIKSARKSKRKRKSRSNSSSSSENIRKTQKKQKQTTSGFFSPPGTQDQILTTHVQQQNKKTRKSGRRSSSSSGNTRAFTKPTATNKVSTIVQQNNPQIKINASLVAHNGLGQFMLAVQYFELLMKNYNYILSELFEPLYPTKIKSSVTSEQKGGACEGPILSLQYQLSDTWHDFGGNRNGIYPCPFNATDFLQDSRSFLNWTKLPPTQDALSEYYKNYAIFEESVRLDYLSGLLNLVSDKNQCDSVHEYTSFYFTEKISTKNKSVLNTLNNYEELKKIIYDRKLEHFKDNVVGKYKYYIIDACMSVQNEKVFELTKLNTLCNLWDPTGTTKIPKNPEKGVFLDNNFNLKLEPQTLKVENREETVYNSVLTSSGTSLYDTVYDPLLNKYSLEKNYKITFKLRLYMENNHYMVCIVVYKGTNVIHICKLEKGGFSVKDLATGLMYIHEHIVDKRNEKDITITISCNNVKREMNRNLKKLLDVLFDNMDIADADADTKKKSLKALIARFKSTGDHGSAETVNFVNKNCGIAKHNTIYLSGDRLCYVYSMMIGNPTLFRYYQTSNSGSDEEDMDELCQVDRVHFLGFYDQGLTEEQKEQLVQEQKTKLNHFMIECLKYNQQSQVTNNSPSKSNADIEKELERQIDKSYHPTYKAFTQEQVNKEVGKIERKLIKATTIKDIAEMEKMLHKVHYLQNAPNMKKLMKSVSTTIVDMIKMVSTGKKSTMRARKSLIDMAYDKYQVHLSENEENKSKSFETYLKWEMEKENEMVITKSENESFLYKIKKMKSNANNAMEKTLQKIKITYSQSFNIFNEAAQKMKEKFKKEVRNNLDNKNEDIRKVIETEFEIALEASKSKSKSRSKSRSNK